jgi:Tfp pilus assembly protein PilV
MSHIFRERGLTLAEVVLAAAIISVAVLAIVGLFPTALQNVQYGGHMSQASSLAQEMIEMIRTRPFADVSLYHNLDTRLPAPPTLTGAPLAHFNRWRSDIAPANPAGALPQGWGTVQVVENALGLADLKEVTITVGWREGGNQTVRLVTYVAPHG